MDERDVAAREYTPSTNNDVALDDDDNDENLACDDVLPDSSALLSTQVGESAYFGGSLVKTRFAMVMAVQVKLTKVWSRHSSGGGGKGRKDGALQSRVSEDMMTLSEFVDVLQLMGLNATMENAAAVVKRWGKADPQTGLIHFRQFLQWCDLDTCFVKKSDLGDGDGGGGGDGDNGGGGGPGMDLDARGEGDSGLGSPSQRQVRRAESAARGLLDAALRAGDSDVPIERLVKREGQVAAIDEELLKVIRSIIS